jgi:hypothetical protein
MSLEVRSNLGISNDNIVTLFNGFYFFMRLFDKWLINSIPAIFLYAFDKIIDTFFSETVLFLYLSYQMSKLFLFIKLWHPLHELKLLNWKKVRPLNA